MVRVQGAPGALTRGWRMSVQQTGARGVAHCPRVPPPMDHVCGHGCRVPRRSTQRGRLGRRASAKPASREDETHHDLRSPQGQSCSVNVLAANCEVAIQAPLWPRLQSGPELGLGSRRDLAQIRLVGSMLPCLRSRACCCVVGFRLTHSYVCPSRPAPRSRSVRLADVNVSCLGVRDVSRPRGR
jgi:hypothetical protein